MYLVTIELRPLDGRKPLIRQKRMATNDRDEAKQKAIEKVRDDYQTDGMDLVITDCRRDD